MHHRTNTNCELHSTRKSIRNAPRLKRTPECHQHQPDEFSNDSAGARAHDPTNYGRAGVSPLPPGTHNFFQSYLLKQSRFYRGQPQPHSTVRISIIHDKFRVDCVSAGARQRAWARVEMCALTINHNLTQWPSNKSPPRHTLTRERRQEETHTQKTHSSGISLCTRTSYINHDASMLITFRTLIGHTPADADADATERPTSRSPRGEMIGCLDFDPPNVLRPLHIKSLSVRRWRLYARTPDRSVRDRLAATGIIARTNTR